MILGSLIKTILRIFLSKTQEALGQLKCYAIFKFRQFAFGCLYNYLKEIKKQTSQKACMLNLCLGYSSTLNL